MSRILLVEDDPRCREPLRMLIEMRSPHKVTTAENGLEALLWLVHNKPDVILLDLYMPVMDGFEFLENYRGTAPVIVVSAWADNLEHKPAKVAALVRKPVSSVELLETITQVQRSRA